jgi:hypothetical protein
MIIKAVDGGYSVRIEHRLPPRTIFVSHALVDAAGSPGRRLYRREHIAGNIALGLSCGAYGVYNGRTN